MQQIRQYFEKFTPMSNDDWEAFSSKLSEKSYLKKELLLKVGHVKNHLSFIEKGIVRYYIPKEENDLTFAFSFHHNFVSAYDSFLTRHPSVYQIEAITDTVVWSITHKDLQDIYQTTSVGNLIGRHAAEENFLKKSKRELSLLNDSAEELYLKLFTEQPQLIQEIPLKYIASYIGITPQALSRIRKRIS
jgi:CRP-like cAMP-binding protein